MAEFLELAELEAVSKNLSLKPLLFDIEDWKKAFEYYDATIYSISTPLDIHKYDDCKTLLSFFKSQIEVLKNTTP